jgi:Ankyrin repeat
MDPLNKIIVDIELHSVEGIRNCFSQGLSPNELFRGEPLIYELVSEYTRTPRFKDCVKTFAEHGLEMEDRILLAVLQDDAENLNRLLQDNPEAVFKKYTLRCAYTPMYLVTLLHICAEYNHTACARVLVQHGADINAAAGKDENGFGGQTPIFHTVNQNGNQSADMMNYLLSQAADLKITVPGFIWGRGYDWETLIPAVNPVSYAAMGLLPQMHRDEKTIAQTVTLLLKQAYGIDYTPGNVPNKYLKG